jgi:hypothetical protein
MCAGRVLLESTTAVILCEEPNEGVGPLALAWRSKSAQTLVLGPYLTADRFFRSEQTLPFVN